MSNKRIMITVLVVLILLVTLAAGCGKKEKKVVLASKPITEQFILSEILTLLIEEETDIKVEQKLGISGGTSNIHPALIKGEIDMYPEYTGTGWLFVLKEDLIRDPEMLYVSVKNAYASEYNVHWSGLYGFNNTYGIAVAKEVAETYDLKTISDLSRVSGNLTFAANPDFLEREDGFKGLEDEYGIQFKAIKEIDIGLRYDAIKSDTVDAITVFSTDGRLQNEEVVILKDDKNFFASYYAATLVRQETLDIYPELQSVLEKLTGIISNEEMIYMNFQVEVENKDPKDVAQDFLQEKGLLN
jgi:osmoprotectant transport system substrate-binding protein